MKQARPHLEKLVRKMAEQRPPRVQVPDTRLNRQEVYLAGTILYAIVLGKENSGEHTFFQGFSINALPEFSAIRQLCKLPAHTDELFQDRSETARWRMYGQSGYSILLVEEEFFEHLHLHPGFVCIISNEATHTKVSDYVAQQNDKRWLHVTTFESANEPKLWDMDRAHIYEWTKSALEEHLKRRRSLLPDGAFRRMAEWEPASVPIASRGHNILTPTEAVFLSLGYSFDLPDETMNGNADDEFANALVTTADTLEATLRDLTGDSGRPPGAPSVIVTVPSVFRQFKPNQLRKEAPPELRKATKAVLRQSQYIAFRATAEEMEAMRVSPLVNVTLGMRASELFLYTAALAVSACSMCCPVLRLPPQLDRVRMLLVGLATLSRKGTEVQRRRNQLALKIGETFRSLIPAPLLSKLEGYSNQGVKLIGDVPLELLPINGLPLSLRCSVSRLPTLPGNLMVRHALMRVPTFLRPSDFHEVLVVRSFKPDDPIRRMLEVSIGIVQRRNSKIKVKFVDVSTEEEFIEAFNQFDGKIAIFDGHGEHAEGDPEGVLSLGNLKINPFKFYGKIDLPPIVLLSACETHTLEGFESSVASALLFMGTRSVLGTLAPVDARMAAMLIARFIYRLEGFLPLLKSPMNWTEVVTGMLRMQYVTDVIFKFEQLHDLPHGAYRKAQMVGNVTINSGDPEWFEKVLQELSKLTGSTVDQVRQSWLDTCYFSETLRHVHLGSPEHIYVFPD